MCCVPLVQRKVAVQHAIQSYQRLSGMAVVRGFRVTYKRHVLTMDDLSTLSGQNWLNDQVGMGPGTCPASAILPVILRSRFEQFHQL